MTLAEVRQAVRQHCLDIRAVDYTIATDKFERTWRESSEEVRERLAQAALAGDVQKLRDVLNKNYNKPYAEMGMIELRITAKRLGVLGFSRLGRVELIAEIHHMKQIIESLRMKEYQE